MYKLDETDTYIKNEELLNLNQCYITICKCFEQMIESNNGLFNSENEIIKKTYDEFIKLNKSYVNLLNYYEQIIENSIDGLFITDGKANVIRVNKAYEELSGIKREEVLGMNMSRFEELKFITESATLKALQHRKPITIEQRLLRTGKKVMVSCNPLFDKDGFITMVVSNVKDITEIELLHKNVDREKDKTNMYKTEVKNLRKQLLDNSNLVAKDEKMIKLLYNIQKIATIDTTVIIYGETGVGKDEIAKFIHKNSKRAANNFLKVNCGAFNQNLLESELFGYESGSFTGAKQSGKKGIFEIADQGTIFLDEIGEMPLDMQVKLLRVLQHGEIIRVGGNTPINVDVRIIAATNKNLNEMVRNKEFREDLFYRLNVIPIKIPPLRERVTDIEPLIMQFIEEYNLKYGFNKSITSNAIKKLENYNWPGNIRELKNIIERLIILSKSDLIDENSIYYKNSTIINFKLKDEVVLSEEVEKFEYKYLKSFYEKYGSVRKASSCLGIKKSTFSRKLKLYSEKYENEID